MTRHAFVLPDQEMVVFWAPKAACSTIAEVIAFSVLPKPVLDAWDFDVGGPRLLLEQQGYLKDGKAARQLAAARGYKSIAIIRDPYERLISAFVNKFVVKNDRPILNYTDMEPFAFRFIQDNYRALGYWRKPEVSRKWSGITFRQFVTVVCDIIDTSDETTRHLNQHWNTQIPDTVFEDHFMFDAVYSLSTMDNFFELLQARTGIKVFIPHRNASHYSLAEGKNQVDLNALKICENQIFSKAAFEDPELRTRVKASFQNDHDILKLAA